MSPCSKMVLIVLWVQCGSVPGACQWNEVSQCYQSGVAQQIVSWSKSSVIPFWRFNLLSGEIELSHVDLFFGETQLSTHFQLTKTSHDLNLTRESYNLSRKWRLESVFHFNVGTWCLESQSSRQSFSKL